MSDWNPVEGLELVDEWTNMNDRDTVVVQYKDNSYQKVQWSEVRLKNRSAYMEAFLLERAPSPEPTRLGAVVEFTTKVNKEIITIVRFRSDIKSSGYIGGPWVRANIGAYSTWSWDTVLNQAVPGTIEVLSLGAFSRPALNPWNDQPEPDYTIPQV